MTLRPLTTQYKLSHTMKEKHIITALYLIGISTILAMEANSVRIPPPNVPDSIGMIKDYIDMLNIIIFPWNGWVVIAPTIYCLYRKQKIKNTIIATIFTALLCGTGDSALSFKSISIPLAIKGAIHYLLIFLFTTTITIAAYTIVEKSLTKIRKHLHSKLGQ